MFLCPKCNSTIYIKNHRLVCHFCKYSIPNNGGIINFLIDDNLKTSDYDVDGLDTLYKAEEKHFWFINRKSVIINFFNKYIDKDARIIEVGAGTGNVAKAIINDGYTSVAVGEIYRKGLEFAKEYGIKELYQIDLLKVPFREHFEVVGMFDVLEHFENEKLILNNILAMLKPDGCLIITVPAHQCLWNFEDERAGHKRRYNLKDLSLILKNNGYNVVEIKHFFISILPLLLLRKYLGKCTSKKNINKEIKINPIINSILNFLTRFESILFKHVKPKIGGSIIAIAKKHT